MQPQSQIRSSVSVHSDLVLVNKQLQKINQFDILFFRYFQWKNWFKLNSWVSISLLPQH